MATSASTSTSCAPTRCTVARSPWRPGRTTRRSRRSCRHSSAARSGKAPGKDPLRRDAHDGACGAVEAQLVVLPVLGHEQIDGAGELAPALEHVAASLHDHVAQRPPVLVVVIDRQGHTRIVGKVAHALEVARALGLAVHGGIAALAVIDVADGDDQGLAGGVDGGETADAGVSKELESPRRRLHRHFLMNFAYWSSRGRTLSRPWEGSRRIARVTPAPA